MDPLAGVAAAFKLRYFLTTKGHRAACYRFVPVARRPVRRWPGGASGGHSVDAARSLASQIPFPRSAPAGRGKKGEGNQHHFFHHEGEVASSRTLLRPRSGRIRKCQIFRCDPIAFSPDTLSSCTLLWTTTSLRRGGSGRQVTAVRKDSERGPLGPQRHRLTGCTLPICARGVEGGSGLGRKVGTSRRLVRLSAGPWSPGLA